MRDLKRHARADAAKVPDQAVLPAIPPTEVVTPSRWQPSAANLDIFWPILAMVLVVAVIFVASVAHWSMNGVGARLVVSGVRPLKPPDKHATMVIVQISSHPTRPEAQAAADTLAHSGTTVKILDSDDYRPLNRGYFVVYAGPFPATTAGRAAARHLQAQLPGSLLRDIRAR